MFCVQHTMLSSPIFIVSQQLGHLKPCIVLYGCWGGHCTILRIDKPSWSFIWRSVITWMKCFSFVINIQNGVPSNIFFPQVCSMGCANIYKKPTQITFYKLSCENGQPHDLLQKNTGSANASDVTWITIKCRLDICDSDDDSVGSFWLTPLRATRRLNFWVWENSLHNYWMDCHSHLCRNFVFPLRMYCNHFVEPPLGQHCNLSRAMVYNQTLMRKDSKTFTCASPVGYLEFTAN